MVEINKLFNHHEQYAFRSIGYPPTSIVLNQIIYLIAQNRRIYCVYGSICG